MPSEKRETVKAIDHFVHREAELLAEIEMLENDIQAFVAVALQHGLREYCEVHHPEITRRIDAGIERSRERAEVKYAKILSKLLSVPGLLADHGETGERTYYRDETNNIAYIEHALIKKRFVLSGIWVAPEFRKKGIAHRILRHLVEAADDADFGIALFHEPFGDQGLSRTELEAFYNRHGFQKHESTPNGMFRFSGTPLDRHAG